MRPAQAWFYRTFDFASGAFCTDLLCIIWTATCRSFFKCCQSRNLSSSAYHPKLSLLYYLISFNPPSQVKLQYQYPPISSYCYSKYMYIHLLYQCSQNTKIYTIYHEQPANPSKSRETGWSGSYLHWCSSKPCKLHGANIPSTGKKLFIVFNDMYQTCRMTSSTWNVESFCGDSCR